MVIRKFSLTLTVFVFITLGIVNSKQAKAASVNNKFGLANPIQTITFDEKLFPKQTPITTQYANLGVTFSRGLFYSPDSAAGRFIDIYPQGFPNITLASNYLGNFFPCCNDFSIRFTQNQTEAAFAMATNEGSPILTALLNGVVVETFSVTNTVGPELNSNNYYGFSGILFNEIKINPNDINNFAIIDNLQTGVSVPEPSFILSSLTSSVLVASLLLKRKQKQKAKVESN